MLKTNKYFSLLLVAVIALTAFSSCEQREDWRFPELGNGGFVKFVSTPEFDAGLDFNTSNFNALVEDPNGTVASYNLTVAGTWPQLVNGELELVTTDTIPYKSTTTFPLDVSFSSQDMAVLFNVSVDTFTAFDSNPNSGPDLDRFTSFEFFGTATTVDGIVYDYRQSACVDCPVEPGDPNGSGAWNGANTDQVLMSAAGLLQAFNYEVTFDDPDE